MNPKIEGVANFRGVCVLFGVDKANMIRPCNHRTNMNSG